MYVTHNRDYTLVIAKKKWKLQMKTEEIYCSEQQDR